MTEIKCCADHCQFADCGKCGAPAAQCGDTKTLTGDCNTCGNFQVKGNC